jgi:hypothetical protein
VPVLEELEILAHDKCVKEALVDHVESADRTILPGIADEELQDGRGRRAPSSSGITATGILFGFSRNGVIMCSASFRSDL